MARRGAHSNTPTIPDNKMSFYREQLYRELSHMFEWKNLPSTIPHDYLERNLIRHGHVMFYYDDSIGLDILRAEVLGLNRHEQPTTARSSHVATEEIKTQVERKIKRLTDSDSAKEDFDKNNDAVLISNMAHGQNCKIIVDHFAERLALVQQAFDTNLLWQNIPRIFLADGNEMKLSYEKLFNDIFSGKPAILADKQMFMYNKPEESVAIPTDVQYIGKELMDTRNELMMKFRETVGFDTAGVDKAERLLTGEIESNEQHTKTVMQIMLEQRLIAAENINDFFDENVSVGIVGAELLDREEGEEVGTGDGGAEELIED